MPSRTKRRGDVHQRRPLDALEGDQELGIDRLQQGEVQIAGPDQLAELVRVGHAERLDEAVDQPRRAQKHEELVLAPPRLRPNVGGVAEDDQVEADVHQRPGNRGNALQQEVGAERHVADQAVPGKGQEDFAIRRMFAHRRLALLQDSFRW